MEVQPGPYWLIDAERYDPRQARDSHGRWVKGSRAYGSVGEVIDVGDDIDLAARLIAEGRPVRLRQPEQVATLIDRLAEVAQEMQRQGQDAPDFDLCNITVKGTNLFCIGSKGIPRIQMPQVSGKVVPGGKADRLLKAGELKARAPDAPDEVDLTEQFREYLTKTKGYHIAHGEKRASRLRATQSQLVGPKVAQIMDNYASGKWKPNGRSIFISKDNYILDGHHTWAGVVGYDAQDNKLGDVSMSVDKVNTDIGTLLTDSLTFLDEWGIEHVGMDQGKPKTKRKLSPGTDQAVQEALQRLAEKRKRKG